jgi:hypothetical protein
LVSYPLLTGIICSSGVNPVGLGVVTPQILKWGSWRGLGVVEGMVSGLLCSKGEGREPRTPSFQTRFTPLIYSVLCQTKGLQ